MRRSKPLRADPEKTREWQQRSAAALPRSTPLRAKRSQKRSRKVKSRRDDGPWRAAVLALYGPSCVACGGREHVQADHIWPRSQGGPSDVGNGIPLCGEFGRGKCHPRKTAGTMLIRPEWLKPVTRAFLAAAGWVDWDDNGQPYGRGCRHFAPLGAR
jgi:5-methylcytosine-specific restriction endonuclease McrA